MSDPFFKPVSGFDLPRFAGVPTFMRLPHVSLDAPKIKDVDVGIIGVPWDSGTTNRPGPRHGPRQLRDASTMIRAQHPVSGTKPYEKLKELTRGKSIDQKIIQEFVQKLDIPDDAKFTLLALTPRTYLGNAISQADDI